VPCDIPFETVYVRLAAPRELAVESPARWLDYLDRVYSYQLFNGYVKDKGTVVSYSVAKRHHAGIADLEVARHSHPFNWLRAEENVVPGLVPVCCTIASCRSSPSLSTSSFPSGPLITCLLWSKKRIILSPALCHSLICFTKCFWNRTSRLVRSFFFVMNYCRCCWYVIPKFALVFLHGLYAVITCMLWPFVPLNNTQLHHLNPSLLHPVFLM
jgi:hypothetical protein